MMGPITKLDHLLGSSDDKSMDRKGKQLDSGSRLNVTETGAGNTVSQPPRSKVTVKGT
jgi:hypothetical protein